MTNATIGLQVLLDMNNLILDQEDGYWIKIQAWEVQVSRDVPHGVRYAFTSIFQLITDFFEEVDRILIEVKKK